MFVVVFSLVFITAQAQDEGHCNIDWYVEYFKNEREIDFVFLSNLISLHMVNYSDHHQLLPFLTVLKAHSHTKD